MEQNNIEKTINAKQQAIITETNRITQLLSDIHMLENQIKMYQEDTTKHLNKMQEQYELMLKSYNSGLHFIKCTQKFINSHTN